MGKSKKPKKKKGCLGLLVNFILLAICLIVTCLLFYFTYLVVKGNPDPVGELKKLPEQAKELPEIIQGLLDKKEAEGEGEAN